MRLLVWCMGFGLVHLFFGLGIAGAQYLKDHDFVGWFSDVFSWYLFISGLVLMLLPSELFGSIAGDSFDFSGITKLGPIPKYMALAGMIIILLMQERSKKNPILRVLLGAYDVYGVTSWLSDVLSYSRLLALGLATGVIANVINMMAVMGGDSAFGVIVFILVFVLGHTLCPRTHPELLHQRARGLCPLQPSRVCRVLRQVLRGRRQAFQGFSDSKQVC